MDLQEETVYDYIRSAETSESSIRQISNLLCQYSNKEQSIADCFYKELKRADQQTQKVIIYLMTQIIIETRAQTNAFIVAFGSIILKVTEHIVKNSSENNIQILKQAIKQWEDQYLFHENLFKRCNAIINKYYQDQQQKIQEAELEKQIRTEEKRKKLEQFKIIRQNKETQIIFDLRRQRDKLIEEQQKCKDQVQTIDKIENEEQKSKLKQQLITQMKSIKEQMINLFVDMNKELVKLTLNNQFFFKEIWLCFIYIE